MRWTRPGRAMLLVYGVLILLLLSLLVPQGRALLRAALPIRWVAEINAYRLGYRVDPSIRIAAKDGTVLAATLYRPSSAAGPLPTVFIRVPYGRNIYGEAVNAAQYFAPRGYAVLVEDLRGTFESGGEQLPYRHATSDGVDTLEWITKQPWSNGRVGTFGCSALGETQFSLARARHPAHRAMIASGAGGGAGRFAGRHAHFGVYEGGVFQLASGFGWFAEWGDARQVNAPRTGIPHATLLKELPVAGLVERVTQAANGYRFFASTPPGDPAWDTLDYFSGQDRLAAPALIINTWGDQTVGDTLALAEHLRRQQPEGLTQNVIIGPGTHCHHEETGEFGKFGDLAVPNAARPYAAWYLEWFEHYLKDIGPPPAFPAYQYYVIGEGAWRVAPSWPPPEATVQRWHLDSTGRANGRQGDGVLRATAPANDTTDRFRNDPMNPVPTRGGPICCTGNAADRAGPVDQADVESREDVLVYTSPPLEKPLRIAGPLKAEFTVSSSAPDTDFIARLVHVWPDGRATGIQEGALRVRYRNGLDKPALMVPGERVRIAVDMRAIAYLLPAGHRLRLTISSTSFPRLERNLNTGGNNAEETRAAVSENRLHHGPAAPAWVELPVIP